MIDSRKKSKKLPPSRRKSKPVDLSIYQAATAPTAIYPPEHGLVYTALGLASEAGEVAGKVKKAIRDEGGVISIFVLLPHSSMIPPLTSQYSLTTH